MSDYIIELSKISRSFNSIKVLDNVSCSFPKKGIFGIVGHSGCGKSTLIKIIAGLDDDYLGNCLVLGKESRNLKQTFRLKNIGLITQDYQLMDLDSVENNILITLDPNSSDKKSFKHKKIIDLLNTVGLKEKIKSKANILSGGEKQRVCIARALSSNPQMLLCDEPTGSLDTKNAIQIFKILRSLSKQILVLVVTHDIELASTYCDQILYFKNGNISNKVSFKQEEKPFSFSTLEIKKKTKNNNLSKSFYWSHTLNVFKNKKWRSLLCSFMLSFGLLGLGLSTYVKDCISTEIGNVLDSIVPKNQINVSQKNTATNALNNIYSAPLSYIENICGDYSDDINDYGISYIVDYESFFADSNRLYVIKGAHSIVLPSFSARSINDFFWLDEYKDLKYFPKLPQTLYDDEIVLGLPYSDMVNLCYGLQILRNYEALGDYIRNIGLQVIYSFANYSWQYEDEQVLNVRAIVAFSKPTIFHSNHRWNESMFEESMRFPVNDYNDKSLPWILNKVYFIEPYNDKSALIKRIRKDNKYPECVFEPPSYAYEMTHCIYSETCDLRRIYVYIADKKSIPYADLSLMSQICNNASRIITTNGSFVSFPDSLLSGFYLQFFLTPSLQESTEILDGLSFTRKEEGKFDYKLPDKTVDGNYLKSVSGGLKISSNFSEVDSFFIPQSVEEISVSTSLGDKWGYPKEVYCVAQIGESEEGDYIHREMRVYKLKIVGYIENNNDTFYVVEDWTIDFFRDCLGMSSFYLEPTGALLSISNPNLIDTYIRNLSIKFPQYRFSNPSKEIQNSISSTTEYIGTILTVSSIISLIISVILFVTIIAISIIERERESSLLYKIGIKLSNIAKVYSTQCKLFMIISFSISSFSLLISEVLTEIIIQQSFGLTKYRLSINFKPFVIIIIFLVVFYLVNYCFLKRYFKRKYFEKI